MDRTDVFRYTQECDKAKSHLIEVVNSLLSVGAVKEAAQLDIIIIRPDEWNRKIRRRWCLPWEY